MPTKFDPEVWEDVRARMAKLITKGTDPREAAEQVSKALKGKPAAGTIFNKYRDGWRTAPNARGANHTQELNELRETVAGLYDRLNALESAVNSLTDDGVTKLIEDRARAEGAAKAMTEAFKEVVLVAETGQNGHAMGVVPGL